MTYTLIQTDGDDTRVLAAGSARECLVAAAWACESGDLHDLRLDVLPHIQRRVAQVERNLGKGAAAVAPGEDAEAYPAAAGPLPVRPVSAAATRAAEMNQPHAG